MKWSWLGLIGCVACVGEMIVPELQGIILEGSEDPLAESQLSDFKQYPIQSVGLFVPGQSATLVRALEKHIGDALTTEDLLSIKQKIIFYYQNQGYPFVIVSIPEQKITDGVIRLLVEEGKVDKVKVYGNRWFSKQRYRNAIHLAPGDSIDECALLNDLSFLHVYNICFYKQ